MKEHTYNFWLVSLVAIVAIVSLVTLFLSATNIKLNDVLSDSRVTGRAFTQSKGEGIKEISPRPSKGGEAIATNIIPPSSEAPNTELLKKNVIKEINEQLQLINQLSGIIKAFDAREDIVRLQAAEERYHYHKERIIKALDEADTWGKMHDYSHEAFNLSYEVGRVKTKLDITDRFSLLDAKLGKLKEAGKQGEAERLRQFYENVKAQDAALQALTPKEKYGQDLSIIADFIERNKDFFVLLSPVKKNFGEQESDALLEVKQAAFDVKIGVKAYHDEALSPPLPVSLEEKQGKPLSEKKKGIKEITGSATGMETIQIACADLDKDGYQQSAYPKGCTPTTLVDCADSANWINPGIDEWQAPYSCDGFDNNCDKIIDGYTRKGETCPNCTQVNGSAIFRPGYSIDSTGYKIVDSCVDSTLINESKCVFYGRFGAQQVSSFIKNCPTSYSCVDPDGPYDPLTGSGSQGGACRPGTGNICTDADKDGYQNPNSPRGCRLTTRADCNDGNTGINPAATEVCNNVDDNCDNIIDGNTTNGDLCPLICADADKDSFQNPNSPAGCKLTTQADCDDTRSTINPNAQEVCNNLDDNCDLVGDGYAGQLSNWVCPATGVQKGIVLLIDDWITEIDPSADIQAIRAAADNAVIQVHQAMAEMSYDKLDMDLDICEIKGVHVSLPSTEPERHAAAIELCDPQVNFPDYDLFIFYYSSFHFGGSADNNWKGTTDEGMYYACAIIVRDINMNILNHEIGHCLRALRHAKSYECRYNVYGPGCSYREYGDVHDTMGMGGSAYQRYVAGNIVFYPHYNCAYKEHLGWLNAVPIREGSYTLASLENSAAAVPQCYSLEVDQSLIFTDSWFGCNKLYIEYRKPVTSTQSQFDGLALHCFQDLKFATTYEQPPVSYLLDCDNEHPINSDPFETLLEPHPSICHTNLGYDISFKNIDATTSEVTITKATPSYYCIDMDFDGAQLENTPPGCVMVGPVDCDDTNWNIRSC